MTSNRPYLVKAIYEWIMDNGVTPHVVINALDENVMVPQQYVDEGKIILNVNPSAVQDLVIDDECIMFSARFGGKPYNIYAPMHTIMGIYAAENGQGMSFEIGDAPPPKDDTPPPRKKPTLRVVK
ncbi:MAG: ClpXP protease specificity-enhancing factor [Aquificaceae bacterium]|nr:MAG: ClpXP protease specificity-enhancing factor [Aquificaceae bacterium]